MKKNTFIILVILIMFTFSCKDASDNNSANSLGNLIITEVGNGYYTNDSYWLEVYNDSTETADLSLYRLTSSARDISNSTYSIYTFSLPSLSIPPGAYALIRGKENYSGVFTSDLQSSGRVAYIGQNSMMPHWRNQGHIELISNGVTSDIVKFGDLGIDPVTSSAWIGADSPIPPYASSVTDVGQSIARDGSNSDTDSAADWTARTFATPGGPNDVTSTVDADNDGIPDANEESGTTFAGLPLYDWGARTGQTDLFVHIDYMNSSDPGVIPREEALQAVVDAFALQSITLHFDAGNLYHPESGSSPADFDLDDLSHQVHFAQGVTLGDEAGKENLYNYKLQYMDLARRQIFHYLLFGYTQQADGSGGSSGLAEINGNDFIVTLGNWGLGGAAN